MARPITHPPIPTSLLSETLDTVSTYTHASNSAELCCSELGAGEGHKYLYITQSETLSEVETVHQLTFEWGSTKL